MTTRGWTVDEACAQFAEAGIPVDPARLRMVIRALRLQPVGETSRDGRGRGQALYDIGQLQRLHSALAPWLAKLLAKVHYTACCRGTSAMSRIVLMCQKPRKDVASATPATLNTGRA